MDGMLKSAVQNLTQKYIPPVKGDSIFIPSEQYHTIYDLLEVWDKDGTLPDVREKAEFIFNTLKDKGNPRELLISMLTDFGQLKFNENKLDKVYRYIRLGQDADKAKKHYDYLLNEMGGLKKQEDTNVSK